MNQRNRLSRRRPVAAGSVALLTVALLASRESHGQEETNVARLGIAMQSTTGFDGSAGLAIDDNTSGVYDDGSTTHTDTGDPAPFWEVDLRQAYELTRIVLWNRTDECCAARLSNFQVSVLDGFGGEVWSEAFFEDGTEFPETPDFEIELPPDVSGQIVRVDLLGPNADGDLYLSLAEVEVFTDEEIPVSIAIGGRAFQSTTGFGGTADRAIDGSRDGVFNNGSMTHTNLGDPSPWWEVRLPAPAILERIVLWNRTECCQDRLSNFSLSVLDAQRNPVFEESFYTDPGSGFVDPVSGLTIEEVDGMEGLFVRIEILGATPTGEMFVSLAEVEVFGELTAEPETPPQECDEADTTCTGLTVEGPEDGGLGDYRVTADANDASGDLVFYTFTFDNGRDAPLVFGPQYVNFAATPLGLGNWTVTMSTTDREACLDEPAEASCTETIEVRDASGNVALGGVATQSTTGYGGVAGIAIDGQIADGNAITHTNDGDPTPWWEVDLGETFAVDRIVLWNRTFCCQNRLSNFQVSILDADRGEIWAEVFFEDGASFPDTSVEGFEIDVGGEEGSIVRVELLEPLAADGYLSLVEVQVFAESAPEPTTGFRRGDVDGNGSLEITDAINNLAFQFLGTFAPTCLDALDWDDNGAVEVTDPIGNLTRQFLGGNDAPAPGSATCGGDPTEDTLGCDDYPQETCGG